jgi:ABC-type phosphate/phosphonate transport system permease subunit
MWAWVWFQAAKLLLTYFIVRLILEFVRVVDELVRLVSKIM